MGPKEVVIGLIGLEDPLAKPFLGIADHVPLRLAEVNGSFDMS